MLLSRTQSLLKLRQGFAAFKPYDYTDALNFKSLLSEDELMVALL